MHSRTVLLRPRPVEMTELLRCWDPVPLVIRVWSLGPDARCDLVRLSGVLCSASVAEASVRLGSWIDETSARRIVVDLEAVDFMDARGVTLLVEMHRRCVGGGRELELGRLSGCARRLVDLCGLDVLVGSSPPTRGAG